MKIKADRMNELKKFGFVEDPANINEGCSSHYASRDNFYRVLPYENKGETAEARLVVNFFSGEIEILQIGGSGNLRQICDLNVLYDLIAAGMVEE